MKTLRVTYIIGIIVCLTAVKSIEAQAQEITQATAVADTLLSGSPRKVTTAHRDSTITVDAEQTIKADSLTKITGKPVKAGRDWTRWKPNPKRAMWLALVCPGAGQIYNRKFWKLPIFAGGFVGCLYAYSWNNQMYQDYKQAYLDLTDDDPTTKSYEQFMHFGTKIDDSNKSRYESLFSKRKDRFRRYRDLSFFCIIGVYALSVVDAYVDASLSEFDITDDLSLHVEPTVINNGTSRNPLQSGSLGVQCCLTF